MKFAKLNNYDWLFLQYEINKKTSYDIAGAVGCSQANVYRALKKLGILTRSNSEAQKLVSHKSSYSVLNDKHFLQKEYIEKGKSTLTIALENNIKSCNSVRQALLRHKIEVRDIRKGLVHKRKTDHFVNNREALDGSLTGDASLRCFNKDSSMSAPYFIKANKHYPHVLWTAKQLFSKGAKSRILSFHKGLLNGSAVFYPGFRTLSHDSLMPYFKRWYPEVNPYGGKPYEKIIPEDVSITPLSLLHCFLDDGNTYQRRKNSKTKQVYITLCLEGFYRDNLEMYCEKIKKMYGNDIIIKTRPYVHGKKYRIGVTQKSYSDFMNIIGPCPEELKICMGHKWK